jgi:hypothetical protein
VEGEQFLFTDETVGETDAAILEGDVLRYSAGPYVYKFQRIDP